MGVAEKAQAYILEKVPEEAEKYGKNVAYFCTNDDDTEPLQPMEYGGLLHRGLTFTACGYPGALGTI